MKPRLERAALLTVVICLAAPVSSAKMMTYTDGAGKRWYVDSELAVPGQYQDSIKILNATSVKASGEPSSPARNRRSALPSRKNSQKKVEIYVTQNCPYCKKLEALLNSQGVKYSKYDIEKDREKAKEFSSLGGKGVPLTKIGDRVIKGFNAEQIMAALNNT